MITEIIEGILLVVKYRIGFSIGKNTTTLKGFNSKLGMIVEHVEVVSFVLLLKSS
jgi:hypothetical protein